MHALLLAFALTVAHLHGTVLSVNPDGTVFVYHDAFNGMPAMTMPFRVRGTAALHPGDRIDAEVDTSSEPWVLSNIHAAAATLPPRRSAGPRVAVGGIAPDERFVDQTGAPFTLARLRGHAYALAFVYTRCQVAGMCPLVSAKFRALQTQLPPRTDLVEVTLDPAYDRPPVLARYAAAYGADARRWHLLGGDPRTLAEFAQLYGILAKPATQAGIVHSERLAIVSPLGRVVALHDGATWSLQTVRAELARTAR